jgi:chromate transporter
MYKSQTMTNLPNVQTNSKRERYQMLWVIFWTFFKISPVTFGGGYVMIPLLERELVERKKFVKSEEITDLFAVSESVPGSIAVNTGTFIGYRLAGIPGAIAAMAGAVLPTFVILLASAILFFEYRDHPLVQAAFLGIRPTIVALIIYAGYKIGKTAVVDKITLVIVLLTTSIMLFSHIHPILTIILGGFLGIVIGVIRKRFPSKATDRRDKQCS